MSQSNNHRVSYASIAGRNTQNNGNNSNKLASSSLQTSPATIQSTSVTNNDEYPPIGCVPRDQTAKCHVNPPVVEQNHCETGNGCVKKAEETKDVDNLTPVLSQLNIETSPRSKTSDYETDDTKTQGTGKSWAGLFKQGDETAVSPNSLEQIDPQTVEDETDDFGATESVSLNFEEDPLKNQDQEMEQQQSAQYFQQAGQFQYQAVNFAPSYPVGPFVQTPFGFVPVSQFAAMSPAYFNPYYQNMPPQYMPPPNMMPGPSNSFGYPYQGMVYYQYEDINEAYSQVMYPPPPPPQVKPLMSLPFPNEPPPITSKPGDNWSNAVDAMKLEQKIAAKMDLVINERFQTYFKINRGSCGTVFAAVDLYNPQHGRVAIKFEEYSETRSNLKYEYDVYKACSASEMNGIVCGTQSEGFARIFWMGRQYKYRILIMQLLGPSLDNLFAFAMKQFCQETIFRLGNQMLDRIERLHRAGFVHRDVKPDNFVMGLEQLENTVFLIDFGLSRKLRSNENNEATYRKDKSLVGTAKYASINSHKGLQLSRRDDLESIGYILIEFINGELPWKPEQAKNQSKDGIYRNMLELKKSTNWSTKCPEMADWMTYVVELGFNDEPNYEFLRIILMKNLENSQKRPNRATPLTDHLAKYSYQESRGRKMSPRQENRNNETEQKTPTREKALDRVKQSTFEWITRRESCPNDKYSYDCLYRWTLPFGHEPLRPPGDNPSNVFGYGYGEGGFA